MYKRKVLNKINKSHSHRIYMSLSDSGRMESKMNKEKIGSVTPQEKEELLELFKRKRALDELMITFADKQMYELTSTLYEKIIRDSGDTLYDMKEWWKTMSQKYTWKSAKTGKWEIDFENNTIFLINNP